MGITRKKAGVAVGSIAVVGAAVALTAGTYSYFSDQQPGRAQSVRAGTIRLDLTGTAQSARINIPAMRPGSCETKTIEFDNNGSLGGWLRVDLNTFGNDQLNQALKIEHTALTGDQRVSLVRAAEITRGAYGKHWVARHSSRSESFTVCLPDRLDSQNTLQNKTGGFRLVADIVQGNGNGGPDKDGF